MKPSGIILLVTLILLAGPASSASSQMITMTYLEGHISQDTTWTLEESPYLVTGDVIVDAGATLRIEAGVDLRFDGDFSLAIAGTLHAVGNNLNRITFTSDRLEPERGDWNTIRFTGAESEFFEMKYCVVMYATYGITMESTRNAVVEKCAIVNNRYSGIDVKGESNITIKENVIESSREGISATGAVCSGITMIGNSISSVSRDGISIFSHGNGYGRIFDMTISNNTVSSDERGIYLYTSGWYEGWISHITISDNTVSSNGRAVYLNSDSEWLSWMYDVTISGNRIQSSDSGIYLHAYHFGQRHPYENLQSATTIIGNILLANDKGIYVGGDIKANITSNSISYNVYGIYYDWKPGMLGNVANRNDIYRNSLYGIYATGGTVNAEYNYWGHPSGPYHQTLNPNGKGDSVGGDGGNVDFEPFLTNERPVASLQVDNASIVVDRIVTFNASASDGERLVSEYLFSFGDGENSSWTASSVVEHNYTLPGVYNASLLVMDDLGVWSNNTATVTITVAEKLPSLVFPAHTWIWIIALVISILVSAAFIARRSEKQKREVE